MLKSAGSDGEESRSEQKQLAYWEKEEVGMCLRESWEAGWEALPSYPPVPWVAANSQPASFVLVCVCVFTGVPSND